MKDIEDNLGSAIFNRFDKIIHFNDLSNDAKYKIGEKIFYMLSRRYKIHLEKEIKERLEIQYCYCENVRQIKRLVEDTFALASILERNK